ncbi:VWA domain-containing protein [Streptomyces sp. NPDC048604]|uniref:VWA domain-containing protein n=1 Tax=Streptomyces sp. NPDC048604 TaxID=3365578 RepID=UPI00370FDFEA
MGIRSLLRKVFGRDRAEQNESPATSVPTQAEPTATTTATKDAPTVPAQSQAEKAAQALVAASFDNPPQAKVPEARTEQPASTPETEPVAEPPVTVEELTALVETAEIGTEADAAKTDAPEAQADAANEPAAETAKSEAPAAEAEPETAAAETVAEEPVAEAEAAAEEPEAVATAEEPEAQAEDAPEAQAEEAQDAEAETPAEPVVAEADAEETPAADEPAAAAAESEEPAAETEAVATAEEPEAKAEDAPEAQAEEAQDAEAQAEDAPAAEPEAQVEEPAADGDVSEAADDEGAREVVVAAAGTPALTLARVKKGAPQVVDAYKAAGAVLKAQGLTGTRAAVYLVVDRSLSMRGYYKDGSVQHLAEQALALAAHLDEEATVPVVFFSTEVDGTGDLTLENVDGRIAGLHDSLGRMGRTNYDRAIAEVLAHHEKADPARPAFVVFQTDGAPESRTAATQALASAADRPIHWRFVAFGEEDAKAFDYLRKLDVPHAAFFHAGPTPAELPHPVFFKGLLDGYTA